MISSHKTQMTALTQKFDKERAMHVRKMSLPVAYRDKILNVKTKVCRRFEAAQLTIQFIAIIITKLHKKGNL